MKKIRIAGFGIALVSGFASAGALDLAAAAGDGVVVDGGVGYQRDYLSEYNLHYGPTSLGRVSVSGPTAVLGVSLPLSKKQGGLRLGVRMEADRLSSHEEVALGGAVLWPWGTLLYPPGQVKVAVHQDRLVPSVQLAADYKASAKVVS